jgi:carbon-monoxide dehydrogenase large subunit
LIGTSPRRVADQRFVTGHGRYLDDVGRADALHLGVVRSVWPHARLRSVNLDAARAMPGVVAAWSAADLGGLAVTLPTVYGGSTKGRPWAIPVLAREVTRYVGEPVAVVVADDPYRLADALESVTIDADPLAALPSATAAQQAKTTLHEGWADNAAITVQAAVGDAEKALAGADLVVHERLAHARLAGVPLETRGVLAYPEGDTLVVWSSTQSPYSLRDIVETALNAPAEQVRVLIPDVGGGFGPKGAIYPEEVLVAGAARRLGRAVKWVETRRESFLAMGHDREQQHEVRVGFRRDGTIVGVDGRFVADVGAYPAQGDGLTANTVNHLCAPYRVRDYRNTGTSFVTTKTFNAAYRAAGRPEATFVMERLVDIGARRLGLDPVEVRRRNLIRADEMPYKPGLTYKDGVPIAYDPGDFPAAFERLLARFGWDDWRKRQAAERAGPRRIGIGVACYLQGTGLGPFESATVRVDPSGKVYVYIGVVAQGQGHATTLAQVAAGELGVPFDDVTVVAGDTALVPFGMGTGGSRVAANAGPAVARTAREVRAKVARVAAEMLECGPDDIRVEDGRVHVAGLPTKSLPIGKVAHAAIKSKALRPQGEPGLNACVYYYPDTVTWAFGANAAAVEVDTETFAVRVLHYVATHDPGRAINPVIVEGQLQGGLVQGIGAGLMEAVVYDDDGQMLTASLMDYAIPKADDVPMIDVILDEHPSVINELGIKGVGESGCIAPAAAIANAIEDALADAGVTVREVPVTPARLFAARALALDSTRSVDQLVRLQ